MKGVAPNGSMLASSILLIMELPAIEAARPALKPTHTHTNANTDASVTQGRAEMSLCVFSKVIRRRISCMHVYQGR